MLTVKKRKKRSRIWLLPDEEFRKVIKDSSSVKVALSFFGLENKGNNFKTIKQRINEMDIDISHFLNNVEASNLTRRLSKEEFTSTWLVENSHRNRGWLKNYLIKFDLMKYECSNCRNDGTWLNKPITLQLEHINGVSNDNRLFNLCFLCPNCHSQTASFAGRQNKKFNYCPCGNLIHNSSSSCSKCSGISRRKIIWPDIETLKCRLWEMPTTHIAKELGVSDKAVEVHIKNLGLEKPPRGYWSKNGRRWEIRTQSDDPVKVDSVSATLIAS